MSTKIFFSIAIVCGVTLFSLSSMAQTREPNEQQMKMANEKAVNEAEGLKLQADEFIQKLDATLKLSPAQKGRLNNMAYQFLVNDLKAKRRYADNAEERELATNKAVAEFETTLKDILTTEQFELYQTNKSGFRDSQAESPNAGKRSVVE